MAAVPGNSQQPSERRTNLGSRDVPCGFVEDLLSDIFGLIAIAQHPNAEPEDLIAVLTKQRLWRMGRHSVRCFGSDGDGVSHMQNFNNSGALSSIHFRRRERSD